MGNAVQQVGRLANFQESRFQAANRSDMNSALYKRVDLLMLRNRVFRLRIVQICKALSSNEFVLLILRNRVFRVQKYRNEQ